MRSASRLTIETLPDPVFGPGEVIVAAGVSDGETFSALQLYAGAASYAGAGGHRPGTRTGPDATKLSVSD